MSKFIFVEDRDIETGHGWRDIPHRLVLKNPDEDVRIMMTNEDGFEYDMADKDPSYSYAWICHAEYFDRHGYIEDNIRKSHLLKEHQNFKGSDDMESHFEFDMTPKQMKAYFAKLGIEERKKRW